LAVDTIHLSPQKGYTGAVIARDLVIGWLEARPISTASSNTVARFLWEEWFCHYGMPQKIVADG